MNNPLVSVIMPAYNAEKYVKESISSVVSQTYSNWELIVIDDGSTDNTAAVVKQIAAIDQRIKYVYQENGRQGKARNNGLRNAKGAYIAFLDADDLWVPEKLELQVNLLLAKKVDLVYSGSYYFEDKPDFQKTMSVVPGYYQGEKDFPHFLETNRVPILTVAVSKNAIDSVNGFSEEKEIQNAEDLNMWLKLLLAGYSFLAIETPLTHYRLHQLSATAGDRHVIFPILHGLKKISRLYPQYKPAIAKAFYYRINTYIRQNNINDWKHINRLLLLRNNISDQKILLPFWRAIHKLFGKRVFRLLFIAKLKRNPGKIINDDIEKLLF